MENVFEELEQVKKESGRDLPEKSRRQFEVEQSLETLSHYLDGLFRIPGTGWRFGLDSLVGLVPNVGDISTALVSFYILVAGVRYGVPKITLLRMAMNIGLDYVIGIIPLVGDGFDFFWKHNERNMKLIRERGQGKGTGRNSDYLFVAAIILVLLGILAGSVVFSFFLIALFFKGIYDLLMFA